MVTMTVTVKDILDIGLLANGKLPDIYWDFDLSGAELKVLRYVYSNCLRLYYTLRIHPKGKDGSPRFWRGKERMANECHLSYPTFRKTVRNLYKAGILTSMDGIEDEDEVHCIGLKADFLNNALHTLKRTSLNPKKELLGILYDDTTIDLMSINLGTKLDNDEAINKLIKRVKNKEKSNNSSEYTENTNVKAKKSEVKVKTKKFNVKVKKSTTVTKSKVSRVPIIKRTSVIVTRVSVLKEENKPKKKFNLELYQAKRKELECVHTPKDNKILQVAKYYEYKARNAIGSSGFRVLGKNYKEHKNWKFLERIYNLCKENHWDYKVYIDAQFDRVQYYTRKQAYPYLNQFFSEGAINAFHRYVKDYQERFSTTGKAKVKTEKVQSFKEQAADKIVKDCYNILDFMEHAYKAPATKGCSPVEAKILFFDRHWSILSPFYAAAFPWFIGYLDHISTMEPAIVEYKKKVQALQKSKKTVETLTKLVKEAESQLGVPTFFEN